jgi:KipI family sensor histidine kinase inhibitor
VADPLRVDVARFGDAAVAVSFEQRIDPAINAAVHALAGLLRGATEGLGEPVPGYASLLVPFDPLALEPASVESLVREALATLHATPVADDEVGTSPVEIVVRYGGEDGPDLAEVARSLGLTPEQVVELHASVVYRAYLLGFAPGFAYLGELPAELELPRRPTPRQRVPAGSVAIAGRQTAVYPLATPGGWHLIGRTDARLWDPARDRPALIGAGQRVRFVPA